MDAIVSRRGRGDTTAALAGAKSSNGILVVRSMKECRRLQDLEAKTSRPHRGYATLDAHPSFFSASSRPVVFDTDVACQLYLDLKAEINRLHSIMAEASTACAFATPEKRHEAVASVIQTLDKRWKVPA